MAVCVATMEERVQKAALPLHVQKLQRALRVDCLVTQVEKVFGESLTDEDELDYPLKNGTSTSEHMTSHVHLYNFTNVTEERKWVQDLLLSDSEGVESELSDSEQLQIMMELQYKRKKKWRKRLKRDPKLWKYRYFSAGLLLPHDPYPDHIKKIEEQISSGDAGRRVLKEVMADEAKKRKEEERRKVNVQKEKERYCQKLWAFISKKEIPKMAKQFSNSRHIVATNNKRIAQLCQREVKKMALKSQRASKEANVQPRVRRLMREALIYWRRYEKVEREQRRKAEKEAVGQRKMDDEMREARRQQRKLNFLITQTELYAHFMAKKLTGEADLSDKILQQLEDGPLQREIRPGVVVNLEHPEDYDSEAVKAQALANAQSAFMKHEETQQVYVGLARGSGPGGGGSTDLQESFDKQFSLATPMLISDREVPQPSMFKGVLKAYQLKGMNWLANLYDQGINGILADEMGLGKTVQSIAFLAHLAERQSIWGPFLIVSPASTLHNWQQECTRFVPHFKALPYWGNPHERKIIRKYWNQKLLYKENAPFHILITSYQLVVQDVKYFQRVKWQYMILDEAQAIKSSASVRWKVLLSFNCRNRLLLTGTPIQNTMQELWALLHFIMPTMFDSHEEFNEWFSRDIESHAEKKSALDQEQLSRLHMILKPFMLRRIKRDVEHEMAEKIEVHLSCNLSTRQRRLYHGLRQRISIEDLLQSSASQAASKDSSTSHLLNLVMQFRKVCNHPDLFERRDVKSPTSLPVPSFSIPRLLYHEALRLPVDLHRLLTVTLGVHTADHIHRSSTTSSSRSDGCWSFLRLTDTTPAEASTVMLGSLAARLQIVLEVMERVHVLYQQHYWGSRILRSRRSQTQLLLWPTFRTSHFSTIHSPALKGLVFTGHASTTYTLTTHRVFPLKTTAATSAELTEISSTISGDAKNSNSNHPSSAENGMNQPPPITPCSSSSSSAGIEQTVLNGISPYLSTPLPSGDDPLHKGSLHLGRCKSQETGNVFCPLVEGTTIPNGVLNGSTAMETETPRGGERTRKKSAKKLRSSQSSKSISPALVQLPCSEYHCMPTDMPKFLTTYIPKVQVPWNPIYCSDRSAEFARQEEWLAGGPSCLKQLLFHGRSRKRKDIPRVELFPPSPAGVDAMCPPTGWSHIYIPDKENMIYDSGKMVVLDKLLATLKMEDHRVLIYSQMTRTIDLLEEFMAYRRYKYIRLDGSSKISDRRDMVDDFQTKSDIFVFLLSTRAGGLGINLTAADTVIFYDSDWNPTVDQQAMDRAHRLGQTKQVTVYRLVVKGTIEERILQRAREKSEIQKMVISGGDFKPDALKPKEMVSLLLDDEEMETRFLAKQAERRALQEQQVKKKNRKRRNNPNGRENEPLLKRPNAGLISGTPSPLMFSRPDSVLSLTSTGEVMNGEDVVDVVGSTDGSEVNSESSRPGSTPVRQRGGNITRTLVPLGGRGKMHRKKLGGGGSGSAAASAGAMAGALAATNAAYSTYGYGIPTYHISPSPSNSLAASPASTFYSAQVGSTHSSPRASPVPTTFVTSQTPPSSKSNKSSLSYAKSTTLQ